MLNSAIIPRVAQPNGASAAAVRYGQAAENTATSESWAKGSPFTARLGELTLDKGFITRVWDVMHFAPPLVATEAEIDRMVEIADEALTIAEREFADDIVA